jgi:hypothetical protein
MVRRGYPGAGRLSAAGSDGNARTADEYPPPATHKYSASANAHTYGARGNNHTAAYRNAHGDGDSDDDQLANPY